MMRFMNVVMKLVREMRLWNVIMIASIQSSISSPTLMKITRKMRFTKTIVLRSLNGTKGFLNAIMRLPKSKINLLNVLMKSFKMINL